MVKYYGEKNKNRVFNYQKSKGGEMKLENKYLSQSIKKKSTVKEID